MTTIAASPYRLVTCSVARVVRVGESFRRITLTGPDVTVLDSGGRDQRIKLILPLPDLGFSTLPREQDWYPPWRELLDGQRNPIRTYTLRELRPAAAEIDIDIAVHGRIGPASRWAMDAAPGDEVVLWGPNREHGGPYGGVDFLPPVHTGRHLLVADPTALPAVAGILRDLPSDAAGEVVIEVDHATDAEVLDGRPPGMAVHVVVRTPAGPGSTLIPAVRAAATRLIPRSTPGPTDLEDVDVDTGLLWEAPRDENDAAALATTDLYAWLAGEAAVIKTLRRHLVSERGLDRKSVAFMGYWRSGREEDNR